MIDDDRLARIEAACHQLNQAGQSITFDAVADRAEVGRATLYRRPEFRAVVEEHRLRAREAHTLSGLARDIDNCAPHWKPSPPRSAAMRKPCAG